MTYMDKDDKKFEEEFKDELLTDRVARAAIYTLGNSMEKIDRDLTLCSVCCLILSVGLYLMMRNVNSLEERIARLEFPK